MEGAAVEGRQGRLGLAGRVLAAGHSDHWVSSQLSAHQHPLQGRCCQRQAGSHHPPELSCLLQGCQGRSLGPVSPLTWHQAGRAGQ